MIKGIFVDFVIWIIFVIPMCHGLESFQQIKISPVDSQPITMTPFLKKHAKYKQLCALMCMDHRPTCRTINYNEETKKCSLATIDNSSYLDDDLRLYLDGGGMVLFLDNGQTTRSRGTAPIDDTRDPVTTDGGRDSETTDGARDPVSTIPFVPPTPSAVSTGAPPLWHADGSRNIDCMFTPEVTFPADGSSVQMPSGKCCASQKADGIECHPTPWPCCRAERCTTFCECQPSNRRCSCFLDTDSGSSEENEEMLNKVTCDAH